MHLTAVSVTFRKQVSDGNYGTELAEVTLSATLDEQETVDPVAAANHLFDLATLSVFAKLGQSPSGNVRRAIMPPEPPRPPTPAEVREIEADLSALPWEHDG